MIFEHPQNPTLKQKYRKVVAMDVFDHTAAILNYIAVEFYCYYGMLREQMHTNLTPPTPEHPIIATWNNTNSNMDAEKVHYMTCKQLAGAGCDKNTNLKCSCDWKFKRTIYRVSVRETDVSWQFCLFTTQNTTLFVNNIYISWTFKRHN